MKFFLFFLSCFILLLGSIFATVQLGADRLFEPEYRHLIEGKKIGVITNHTGVNSKLESTAELIKKNADRYRYTLQAFFAPEHGFKGLERSEKWLQDEKDQDGIHIYSLYGKTKRPTSEMLQEIDTLIYDIQDIGSRSYTYISTLCYMMEEAAKHKIRVIVLDRPNPINGVVVDGPLLESKWRSIVSYLNIPYCHGMTIGELAKFFNEEYQVGCPLSIIPMKGWKREMSFADTGLTWIPTSPYIPEESTPCFYPMTGILGELSLVSIGIGYTTPFKVVGAPWIEAETFAQQLNNQHFPGVRFFPFYYRPFYGKFAKELCQGVLIIITDKKRYLPVSTLYLILGTIKNLYPKKLQEAIIAASKERRKMFCQVNGTEEVYECLSRPQPIIWPLRTLHQKEREQFLEKRKKYLISEYS